MLGSRKAEVARTPRSNDDATDRRLRLLVGLVVVLATVPATLTVLAAVRDPRPVPTLLTLIAVTVAVVVANRVKVTIRIRSNATGTAWGEVPVLVGLVLIPAPWVILCAVAGATAVKLFNRVDLHKTAFAAAKETITAGTAAVVMTSLGPRPDLQNATLHVGAVVAAFLAMTIVDDLLFVPVVAVASRTPMTRLARRNWDIKLAGAAIRLALALVVIGVLALGGNPGLLIVVPPFVLCVHLWHTHRVRTRQERESWQRLAQATDELNIVELESVLTTAVTRAAELFSADEVEVELTAGRILRGNADGVDYDGPPQAIEPRPATTVTVGDLAAHDGSHHIGTLRLRFHGRVQLTEFEQYKFRTFASALSTAVRNAGAYAELGRIAQDHAFAAAHDPLTGLANRRFLLERTEQVLARRAGDGINALLLIDLNHFKEVNDTLGHTAGDQVLTEVARRLATAAGPDDLVARLGGDEFAVLLTGLSAPAVAQHRADLLLTAFDSTIEVDGMQLTVEASGGIALAPGSGGTTELLRRADIAMYQAKRSSQRTAVYLHTRDTADVGRLVLGGELSRAVARDEFAVDFQPLVDLGTGAAVAVEALARWHHPEHGDLDPRRFLQSVERSGHLPAFAASVLEHALTAVRRWTDAGFDLPVSVNVAARSLLDPDFPASVLDRLDRHGIPAGLLVLELTESLTVSQLDVVDRTLADLRDAGVRLALDDFGTGVCSLAALTRLPVHELKLDRSLVRTLDTAPAAAAVVRSTVDLARSLRLGVVAEGVESEPQRRTLWELGCNTGQGHLFARPADATGLLTALERGTGGRPGTFAAPLHDAGAVLRLSRPRRGNQRRHSSLPHLPA